MFSKYRQQIVKIHEKLKKTDTPKISRNLKGYIQGYICTKFERNLRDGFGEEDCFWFWIIVPFNGRNDDQAKAISMASFLVKQMMMMQKIWEKVLVNWLLH